MPLPIDPYRIARSLDVDVIETELKPNTAGFIIREHGSPTRVYLNQADGATRKRFTLAHELGHFIQHEADQEMAFVDRRDELASAGTDPQEIWANQFAAELLMPAAVITKWWAEGRGLERMRRSLKVSEQALALRLRNLGLLSG